MNIDYIITKLETRQKAKVKVGKLLQLVRVASMGQSTIDRAYHSEFSDFEDASQNYCAQENGHKTLITRNTKDYRHSNLAIFTPREYLASLRI